MKVTFKGLLYSPDLKVFKKCRKLTKWGRGPRGLVRHGTIVCPDLQISETLSSIQQAAGQNAGPAWTNTAKHKKPAKKQAHDT